MMPANSGVLSDGSTRNLASFPDADYNYSGKVQLSVMTSASAFKTAG